MKSTEAFKPVPVRSPERQPFLFKLRCVFDLQLNTIVKHLVPELKNTHGAVLDVGAGESPWCGWLPVTANYRAIDVKHCNEFGIDLNQPSVVYYDGKVIPFADQLFDCVLCIEVLEHSDDPKSVLSEINRVLKPGGKVLLTVPWASRLHHIPHDYHRFTKYCLLSLFSETGFINVEIRERGNDIGAIANKLTILAVGMIFRSWKGAVFFNLLTVPVGLLTAALAMIFLFAAHASGFLGMGSELDPLGYFVKAQRA